MRFQTILPFISLAGTALTAAAPLDWNSAHSVTIAVNSIDFAAKSIAESIRVHKGDPDFLLAAQNNTKAVLDANLPTLRDVGPLSLVDAAGISVNLQTLQATLADIDAAVVQQKASLWGRGTAPVVSKVLDETNFRVQLVYTLIGNKVPAEVQKLVGQFASQAKVALDHAFKETAKQ